MKAERSFLTKTARIVSVIGHPFVLLSLTVLIAVTRNETPARAFSIIAVTVAVTVLPLLFIIRRKVVSGTWSDHDISVADERKSFYPLALAVTAAALVIFYLLDFPRALLFGVLISLALLLASWLINRFSKISLHVIFAVYFAVSLLAVGYLIGMIFLAVAVLVAWSRLQLKRHNTAQILSGATLGAFAGVTFLRAIGVL